MTQDFRTLIGGLVVDRSDRVGFTFDGRLLSGYRGDTLASALLANGVHTVGRSLKYRRPRGIFSAGGEEPNALVTVGKGKHRVPNLKATEVALVEGLVASSQRGWPSARRDLGAVTSLLGPLLPSGFYYKTFMRPQQSWPMIEPVLRRAAASGRVPPEPDPARYDRGHLHCDVLVVGAGPAGLAAAVAAAATGERVVVAEADPHVGGCLLDRPVTIDGQPASEWVDAAAGVLADNQAATVLTSTTVFGCYGRERFGAVQHLADGRGDQRYWQIHAGRVVLATGAIERPLLFANNDRPGVMLASAVERYIHRFGVIPGSRAIIITNNDSAYSAAAAIRGAGAEVRAVIDTRLSSDCGDLQPDIVGVESVSVSGRSRVSGVTVVTSVGLQEITGDLVCVSGGWTPTVHLHSALGAPTLYDPDWGAFVPASRTDVPMSAGACGGIGSLAGAIQSGARAGDPDTVPGNVVIDGDFGGVTPGPTRIVPRRGHAFVDLATDVDVHGVEVAVSEGYSGPQHVKRYTTMGMGPDQGKTANINGAALTADLAGSSLSDVGTTTHRPPFVPVALGALAGRESGTRIAPVRRTPMDEWHAASGAVFMPSGLWRRPKYFRSNGEDAVTAATAEARRVRTGVGIADVSTLGKIELRGAGVGELLDFVYTNRFSNLKPGRVRYGLMLRDDGYVMDDGTTSRLSDAHWLLTTTTANAEPVLQHLEYCHQVLRPELDVAMSSVTDQWAVAAVAGPDAREVVGAFFDGDLDVGPNALPFMAVEVLELGGVPVRVARVSFSGELGYEMGVPADHGLAMWERLLDAGAAWGIGPYGLEGMDYLRIEKGHLVVGMDIDGRVSPYDLGLGGLCSSQKDFVGRRSLAMPVFSDPDRPQLAGFVAEGSEMITAGAQLIERAFDGTAQESLGRITSVANSPTLERPIALGLVVGGSERIGERLHAASPVTGQQVAVEVVSPHFYDPAGERQRS
ncbi:MAG: Sarcosine oxidase subunit alpha [Acidimicrobiaceae bacterium]|nr:Sarcosine oxidase subunit alpha [Acidimicrobiaceae bacterium]